jgi:hypothetical protein
MKKFMVSYRRTTEGRTHTHEIKAEKLQDAIRAIEEISPPEVEILLIVQIPMDKGEV